MYDKDDYIIKEYRSRQRKTGIVRQKLYRIICDICGEKQGYGAIRSKINYCKRCQYNRLSKLHRKRIDTHCDICGEPLSYTPSQYNRAKHHLCSKKCVGIFRRKDITEVARSQLRTKILQAGVSPECVKCGHTHLWNLQAHHVIFVCNGGSSELSNLELLCRNCHADLHYYDGRDKE